MPTVNLNNVNIYYESHGSGVPVVFVYGLGGNTGMWAGQVEAFSKHYRFITWDPRGHGRSESPADWQQYGHRNSAEDLRALLDHLGIDKACIGGLSMGGGIVATFAVNYPERVKALIIMDSNAASGLGQSPAMRAMREKTVELAETRGMEAVADFLIESNPNLKVQAEASPEARAKLRGEYVGLNPVGYANSVRTILNQTFDATQLAKLRMPALVLAGETDPALAATRHTHSLIPGAEFVLLPDAGHTSNLDNSAGFNAAILEFLGRQDAAG